MPFYNKSDVNNEINSKLQTEFNDTNTIKHTNASTLNFNLNQNIHETGFLKPDVSPSIGSNFDFGNNGDGTYDVHESTETADESIDVRYNRYHNQDDLQAFSGDAGEYQLFDTSRFQRGYRMVIEMILHFNFIEPDDFFFDQAYFGFGGIDNSSNYRNTFLCRLNKKAELLTVDKILYIDTKNVNTYVSDFSGGTWEIANPDPTNYRFTTPGSPISVGNVCSLAMVIDDVQPQVDLSYDDYPAQSFFSVRKIRMFLNGQEAAIDEHIYSSSSPNEDEFRIGYILRPNNLNVVDQSLNPVTVLQKSIRRFRIAAGEDY